MDEIALIQMARDGDLDAFNRLVLAYQETVFNVAYRILADPSAAEDATQNAFISAYRSLSGYRGGSFRGWLLRIVTNSCYDELRRQKRQPTVSLEPVDDADEEVESPSWIADSAPSPENTFEQREIENAIMRCLKDLPDDFRSVVVLVDLQGLDYQEVAQAIGKPLGTIKSRVARARLKLRDCLDTFGELIPANNRQIHREIS
jgi:RNA polymerase sigma-70 factor (ECF subfamily)